METRPVFFVRLSGPRNEATAALSALREAGFEAREFSRGEHPAGGEAWITAELAAGLRPADGADRSACAEAEEALAAASVSFRVREFGPSLVTTGHH